MKTITRIAISLALLATTACTDDDGAQRGDDTSGGTGSSDGGDSTDASATMGTSATTASTSATTASTTATTTATTGEDSSTGDAGDYEFDDAPPEDFAQKDRMGMPAVATAVITDKDDYNAATPADDADGVFAPQIVEAITALHGALDDDLIAAGLTPCDTDTCVTQAASVAIPDVIRIDLTADAGFPNGRTPTDPVVDITLAVIFLDLTVHELRTFADLPLNPTASDVAPPAEFPYFAEPH
ncbi:MAG: DUF4331 domain-containing protein [Nannocystaceae bacterium]|nr:DUF4331 domain-containing protein [Nannocystaceae bacterium]